LGREWEWGRGSMNILIFFYILTTVVSFDNIINNIMSLLIMQPALFRILQVIRMLKFFIRFKKTIKQENKGEKEVQWKLLVKRDGNYW
jgi:hypothetical protein